jgi:hypothetical protein
MPTLHLSAESCRLAQAELATLLESQDLPGLRAIQLALNDVVHQHHEIQSSDDDNITTGEFPMFKSLSLICIPLNL